MGGPGHNPARLLRADLPLDGAWFRDLAGRSCLPACAQRIHFQQLSDPQTTQGADEPLKFLDELSDAPGRRQDERLPHRACRAPSIAHTGAFPCAIFA
jgi:hypothetical protein